MKVNANKNLEIYPNPLTGNELIVKNISPNTIESISCIDIQGKNIPYAYENCGNNTICIYFDNLAAGTYTLHLSSDSDMYSNKFIVIK
jgi:hypothetical protein